MKVNAEYTNDCFGSSTLRKALVCPESTVAGGSVDIRAFFLLQMSSSKSRGPEA